MGLVFLGRSTDSNFGREMAINGGRWGFELENRGSQTGHCWIGCESAMAETQARAMEAGRSGDRRRR
jgi:hypothetical protein